MPGALALSKPMRADGVRDPEPTWAADFSFLWQGRALSDQFGREERAIPSKSLAKLLLRRREAIMFQRASFAVVAVIAATLALPAGSALAQRLDVEQEEVLRPPEPVPQPTVPRYREARPDEPGLRYRRIDPETSAPRSAEPVQPAPRYSQVEPEDEEVEPRYRRGEPESITTDEAVRIAREEGLARIDRVREGRRGWMIVGIDDNGDDMRVIISRTGEVVAIQRE